MGLLIIGISYEGGDANKNICNIKMKRGEHLCQVKNTK